MIIQIQNLTNDKYISLYDNVPFIFKCFNDQRHSQRREKTSRRYQTRNSQNGPNVFLSSFFFFFLLSSDRLVQICVTLSLWFSHKTAAFFTEQCTSPSLSSRFEVTRGDSNRSLKNYGFLYDAYFLHVYACAQFT